MNIYNFNVLETNGNSVSLDQYQGKVLLVVNTATACGLTPQYTGLQDLYTKYQNQGLEILDFPCNQFGEQAPGTNAEIGEFCTGRFGITFKQFAKINVNGEDEDPLYTWLKSQKKGLGHNDIKWNFTKFLVDQNGDVIKRYAPTTTPEKIEKDIKRLLG